MTISSLYDEISKASVSKTNHSGYRRLPGTEVPLPIQLQRAMEESWGSVYIALTN